MKTIELAIEGNHPALRQGKAYTFTPVIEGGDTLLGYEMHDAATGAFVLYLDSTEVRVVERS